MSLSQIIVAGTGFIRASYRPPNSISRMAKIAGIDADGWVLGTIVRKGRLMNVKVRNRHSPDERSAIRLETGLPVIPRLTDDEWSGFISARREDGDGVGAAK